MKMWKEVLQIYSEFHIGIWNWTENMKKLSCFKSMANIVHIFIYELCFCLYWIEMVNSFSIIFLLWFRKAYTISAIIGLNAPLTAKTLKFKFPLKHYFLLKKRLKNTNTLRHSIENIMFFVFFSTIKSKNMQFDNWFYSILAVWSNTQFYW